MLSPSAADRTLSDAFMCAFAEAVFVFDGGEGGRCVRACAYVRAFGGVTALVLMALMEQAGWACGTRLGGGEKSRSSDVISQFNRILVPEEMVFPVDLLSSPCSVSCFEIG